MTTAGLELSGRVLRYAELEQRGPAVRLLRLGNCDFEFDVEADLFGEEPPRHADTIRGALSEVFEDTTAGIFRFALPSEHLASFSGYVPDGFGSAERAELIAVEADILGVSTTGDVFPVEGSCVGGAGRRIQIDQAANAIRDRLSTAFRGVSDADVALTPSRAAVRTLHAHVDGGGGGPALLVGCYGNATDFIVVDGADPVLEWSIDLTDPVDRLYFGLETLDRAGFSRSGAISVVVYGPDVRPELLDSLRTGFDDRIRTMDPGKAVDVPGDQFDPDFGLEAFAACIGAALA